MEKIQTEEWLDNMAYNLEMALKDNNLVASLKIREEMKSLGYGDEAKAIIDNYTKLARKRHLQAMIDNSMESRPIEELRGIAEAWNGKDEHFIYDDAVYSEYEAQEALELIESL